MAVKKYRFRWRGPTSADLTRELNVQVTRDEPQPVVPLITGVVFEDYSIEETRLQDLKDHLSNPGGLSGVWEFVGQV